MCWHIDGFLWISVPSSSYFSGGLVPTLLAQRLPPPFKLGCMWGVLDDSWHTLMLAHVADCRLAWCTCSTSLWEQEPWLCPRPLPQQGGSSASCSWCSWDLWGRVCVCVCVSLGDWEVQLGEDYVKTFAVFLCALFCSLSVGFCSGVIGRDALPDSLLHPISWLVLRTFPPVQSLLGPLPSYLLDIVLTVDEFMLASVTDEFPKHQPDNRQHRVKSSLCCFVTCRRVGFLLASGNALTATNVRNTNSCIARPVLAPLDPCCSRPWRWPLFVTLIHWSSRWSWRLWMQRWFLTSYRYNCHLLVGWESLLASCLVLRYKKPKFSPAIYTNGFLKC